MHKVQRVNHVQKIISIDSALRTSGAASDFDIDVAMPKSNAFNKCSVVMTEMFKSWYTLDDTTTNSFDISINSSAVTTIAMSYNRIYDSSQFKTELQSRLDIQLGAGVITVDYFAANGKFRFFHSTLPFTIIAKNEMAKYMGLENNVLKSSTFDIPSSTNTLFGTNIVNMQRYDTLSIKASGIQNNGDNVLVRLYPSGVGNFGTFGFTTFDSTNNAVTVENSNMNNMHISVQDNYGKSINLNGVNWRMVVTFFNSED